MCVIAKLNILLGLFRSGLEFKRYPNHFQPHLLSLHVIWAACLLAYLLTYSLYGAEYYLKS